MTGRASAGRRARRWRRRGAPAGARPAWRRAQSGTRRRGRPRSCSLREERREPWPRAVTCRAGDRLHRRGGDDGEDDPGVTEVGELDDERVGRKGAEEAVELLDAERAEARCRGRSDAPEHQEERAENPEPAGEAEEAALREHAEVLAVRGVLVARGGGLDVGKVAGADAARVLPDELQDVLPDGQALGGTLQRRAADLAAAAAEPL